jgi:RNA polymerase subunit RPABC4/transcription elongation factor Spt4/cbb3-type cytochrome oxidase subunit 3
MIFDPTTLSSALLIATAWGGAFLAALWLALIFWVYRDMEARGKEPTMRVLAALLVAVLFLPGAVVYLILRPQRTLEEEYQQTLEEEALLHAIEEVHHCPGCGIKTKESWLVCPNCHTKLRKTCHHCGKLMELSWNLCPHCGTPAPGMRKENLTMDEALRPMPTEIGEEQDN